MRDLSALIVSILVFAFTSAWIFVLPTIGLLYLIGWLH